MTQKSLRKPSGRETTRPTSRGATGQCSSSSGTTNLNKAKAPHKKAATNGSAKTTRPDDSNSDDDVEFVMSRPCSETISGSSTSVPQKRKFQHREATRSRQTSQKSQNPQAHPPEATAAADKPTYRSPGFGAHLSISFQLQHDGFPETRRESGGVKRPCSNGPNSRETVRKHDQQLHVLGGITNVAGVGLNFAQPGNPDIYKRTAQRNFVPNPQSDGCVRSSPQVMRPYPQGPCAGYQPRGLHSPYPYSHLVHPGGSGRPAMKTSRSGPIQPTNQVPATESPHEATNRSQVGSHQRTTPSSSPHTSTGRVVSANSEASGQRNTSAETVEAQGQHTPDMIDIPPLSEEILSEIWQEIFGKECPDSMNPFRKANNDDPASNTNARPAPSPVSSQKEKSPPIPPLKDTGTSQKFPEARNSSRSETPSPSGTPAPVVQPLQPQLKASVPRQSPTKGRVSASSQTRPATMGQQPTTTYTTQQTQTSFYPEFHRNPRLGCVIPPKIPTHDQGNPTQQHPVTPKHPPTPSDGQPNQGSSQSPAKRQIPTAPMYRRVVDSREPQTTRQHEKKAPSPYPPTYMNQPSPTKPPLSQVSPAKRLSAHKHLSFPQHPLPSFSNLEYPASPYSPLPSASTPRNNTSPSSDSPPPSTYHTVSPPSALNLPRNSLLHDLVHSAQRYLPFDELAKKHGVSVSKVQAAFEQAVMTPLIGRSGNPDTERGGASKDGLKTRRASVSEGTGTRGRESNGGHGGSASPGSPVRASHGGSSGGRREGKKMLRLAVQNAARRGKERSERNGGEGGQK